MKRSMSSVTVKIDSPARMYNVGPPACSISQKVFVLTALAAAASWANDGNAWPIAIVASTIQNRRDVRLDNGRMTAIYRNSPRAWQPYSLANEGMEAAARNVRRPKATEKTTRSWRPRLFPPALLCG